MVVRNPYSDASSNTTGPYSSAAVSNTEPNMRQELINTLDGKYPEISKGAPGLLRRTRRDVSGNLTRCGCFDSLFQEPDKDLFCPICFSCWYLLDEVSISYYKTLEQSDSVNALKNKLIELGLLNTKIVVYYLRYSLDLTKEDKIIELQLNDAGSPITPYIRESIYKIGQIWPYRADNGKLEYYKVFAFEEKVKWLNSPAYGDLVE